MLADLRVDFAGLELKNPLMLASATPWLGWPAAKGSRRGGFWRCYRVNQSAQGCMA